MPSDLPQTFTRLRRPLPTAINLPHYLGTPRQVLNVATPAKRLAIKAWLKDHPGLSTAQLKQIINLLLQGKTFEERTAPGVIIQYHPALRAAIRPADYKRWLKHLSGWAEIDTLCQGSLGAQDLLANWPAWQKQLREFTHSKYISHQRASLVLLTKALSQNPDKRLSNLAFQNIRALQKERDILITKAISWILRNLTKHHAPEVKHYLQKNSATLPAIAIRETTRKLATGRK